MIYSVLRTLYTLQEYLPPRAHGLISRSEVLLETLLEPSKPRVSDAQDYGDGSPLTWPESEKDGEPSGLWITLRLEVSLFRHLGRSHSGRNRDLEFTLVLSTRPDSHFATTMARSAFVRNFGFLV